MVERRGCRCEGFRASSCLGLRTSLAMTCFRPTAFAYGLWLKAAPPAALLASSTKLMAAAGPMPEGKLPRHRRSEWRLGLMHGIVEEERGQGGTRRRLELSLGH